MTDAPTPDTLGYLILALAVVTVLFGGYIASIGLRFRSFQQDIKTIEQLNDQ